MPKPLPISEASPQQLRTFATDFLALDLLPSASDADVASAIAAAQPGSAHIFINDEPAAFQQFEAPRQAVPENPTLRPEEQGRGQVGSLGKGDPRCIIEIPALDGDDNTGKADVAVGVNGRAWQLKRGVPLNIPYRVALALDAALADQVRHDNTEGKEGDVVISQVRRFPYQRHEWPTAQQIAAWHAEVDGVFAA